MRKRVSAKLIGRKAAQPLTHLRRDKAGPRGEPIGTYATQPAEVDGILRRAWRAIFRGNLEDQHKAAAKFLAKYDKYVYRGEEFKIGPLTMEEVKETCRDSTKSAAGPDGYEPAEMRLLSDQSYAMMAELLNLIEEGNPWPQGLATGRVAFLEKR